MENNIKEQKCFIKWVAVLIVLIITAVITVVTVYVCVPVNKQVQIVEDTVNAMPESMEFSAQALQSATSSGRTLDVRIEAQVVPYNALNQEVDYSVAWKAGASRISESVSDYITVTQDSNGSTKATVSCKKAFGSDKIIITVTTRDGGYTANCTVSFVGKATGMTITSATAAKKTTSQRGEYFELGTGKTYTFNINLTNAINSVGTSNLSVTTGAYGTLYFGTTASDGSGYAQFFNMQKKELSQFVSKFITSATISGTTLTIKTGSTYIEYFYDRTGMDEYLIASYCYDRYVCEDEWGFYSGMYVADNYPAKAAENAATLPSCYFTVTVTDSASGISQTIKLWIEISVTGVNLSSTLSV